MTITITPTPACIGGKVTICTDAGLPTALTVTFTPPGASGAKSYPLTAEQSCVTVDVPFSAVVLVVHDEGGHSPDVGIPCIDCSDTELKQLWQLAARRRDRFERSGPELSGLDRAAP